MNTQGNMGKQKPDLANCPYWVVLGDIHEKIEHLHYIPEISKACGILVSGDLTVSGNIKEADKVMGELLSFSPNVLAQFGNLDRQEVSDWLSDTGRNMHGMVRCLDEKFAPHIALMGLGGGNISPFGTPSEFTEDWFEENLNSLWPRAKDYEQVILISHTPPLGTKCDLLSDGKTHVGSSALRKFIEKTQPAVCFCGHIHEARSVDTIGRSKILNPGAFMDGSYGILAVDEYGHPKADIRKSTLTKAN